MNKLAPLAVLATLATFSLVPIAVHAAETSQSVRAEVAVATPMKIAEGKMVYGNNGQRLAPVYRVNSDHSVQLILEGRLVTIPATVLADVNGKLTASETRADLLR
jgi:hypothetical protein